MPELHSIAEVSRCSGWAGVGHTTKDKEREIPSVKLGGFIKVRREDLEEYSESKHYYITGRPLVEE